MVQVFVLDADPIKSADELCNAHVVCQGKEGAQILYTILWKWGVVPDGPVECGDRGFHKVYQHPYDHHPITLWGAACQAHAMWIYQHCKAIFAKFTRIYNKKHLSEYHVDHWMNHIEQHGFPDSMPESIEAHEWLNSLGDKDHNIVKNRVCIGNPPYGCKFGILAIEKMMGPYNNNCVESYREYYQYKRLHEFKRPMVWGVQVGQDAERPTLKKQKT